MKKLFLISLTILFAASLNFAQGGVDVKAKIKKMNEMFSEMMVKNDHTGMLDYYTDDCISMPSYQPMLRGVEAIKKAGEKQEKSGMKITAFKPETTDLFPAGNYFIEVGTYSITMEIPGMDTPMDDHGKYVNIWRQLDDGSLKLKIDTWNTDVNPWMEMQKHEGMGKQGEGMGKPEKEMKHESGSVK